MERFGGPFHQHHIRGSIEDSRAAARERSIEIV